VQRLPSGWTEQIKDPPVPFAPFSKFSDISNEEMLLLQRVTATKISQMCRAYEKEYVLSDLISILKHRSTDEQDQIRVLATENFKEVSKILTRD
jgi:predicted metal-dependent phosphotriesterase family hydrolase